MKRYSLVLILCLIALGAFSVAYAARTPTTTTMASSQATTGASANNCFTDEYDKLTVDVVISGTASVNIECRIDAGTSFVALSDNNLPITASKLGAVVSYACKWIQTNVTVCTACTVTTVCHVTYAN